MRQEDRKMKRIIERQELDYIPFDRDFGTGLIHATGDAVKFDDDPVWWIEYYDPMVDEYYYG